MHISAFENPIMQVQLQPHIVRMRSRSVRM